MFCRNCGFQIQDDMKFCPKCGNQTFDGKVFCKNCGQDLSGLDGVEFCPSCGKKLNDDVNDNNIVEATVSEERREKYNRNSNFRKAFFIFSAMLLLLVVGVVICLENFSSKARLREQLELGNMYLNEQDFENAKISFQTVIVNYPKETEAYIGVIEACVGLRDYRGVEDAFITASSNLSTDDLKIIRDSFLDGMIAIVSAECSDGNYEIAFTIVDYLADIDSESESLVRDVLDDYREKEDVGGESSIVVADEVDDTSDAGQESTIENEPVYTINDEGYIVFGKYEQDGNLANGPEPIEWIGLSQNGDNVLLVSRYVLDCVPYNSTYSKITWGESSLRKWLNSDFFDASFSEEEKNIIILSHLTNDDYVCEGGNDTNDHVFCLSIYEILNYYGMGNSCGNEMLITDATAYARANGVFTYAIDSNSYYEYDMFGFRYMDYGYSTDCIGRVGAMWWTRSPHSNIYLSYDPTDDGYSSYACIVQCGGLTNSPDDRMEVSSNSVGVRPAIYITLAS